MRTFQILCAALLLSAADQVAEAETNRPRAALLSQSLQATAGQALDLALVELTKKGDVELVEREAINAVLREQRIALTDSDAGLRVGQLLRADLIGVVDSSPDGKELGGIVVLDSASGVVFANEGLAGMVATEAAALVANTVSASVRKRALPADQRNTLCLLGARNSEFARGKDVFCETVAYLVERRLLQAPGVTTLDRRRLEAVLKENNLPGQAERKALLPSLRLLELDFRRGTNDGEMKVVVRLSDAKGNTVATGEVTGPEEAPKLVELAGAKVCELLRVAPPAHAGDPAAEAGRFRKQAEFLWNRGLKDQALSALDAASALHAGDASAQARHVDRIGARAYEEARSGNFERALLLCAQAMDLEAARGNRRLFLGCGSYDPTCQAIAVCRDRVASSSPLDEHVEALRHRYLEKLGLAGSCPGLSRPPPRPASVGTSGISYGEYFSARLRFPVSAVLGLTRTHDEFFRLLNLRLDDWLRQEQDPAAAHDRDIMMALYDLCASHRTSRNLMALHGWLPFDADHLRGLSGVLARLAAHPRRVVQLEGRFAALLCDMTATEASPGEISWAEIHERAQAVVRDCVAAAGETNTPAGDVPVCYELALHALALAPLDGARDKAPYQELVVELVEGMLARKHLSAKVLECAWKCNTGPRDSVASKAVANANFARYTRPLLGRICSAAQDASVRRMEDYPSELNTILDSIREVQKPPQREAHASNLVWSMQLADEPRGYLGVLARAGERDLYVFTSTRPYRWPNAGGNIDVQRVSLADRAATELGTVPIRAWMPFLDDYWYRDGVRLEFLTDTCLDPEGRLFIATGGDGIVVFSPGATPPARLGEAEGLPGPVIQSLAVYSNVLYVACGDIGYALSPGFASATLTHSVSHFARYDLTTRRCEVIASTGRSTAATPLDALPDGFFLRRIIPDPERDRLLLALNARDWSPATGLWEYRLRDGAIRQLLHTDREIFGARIMPQGLVELFLFCRNDQYPVREEGGWWGLVHFDPRTDRGRLVCVSKNKGAGAQLPVLPETRVVAGIDPAHVTLAGDWAYYVKCIKRPGSKGVQVRRKSLLTAHDELVDESGLESERLGRWGYLDWLPESGLLLLGNGRELRALRPNHDRSAHGLLDATREQFVGRWSYLAQGKQWEREFLADGTARLRVDGKDTPHFDGFTWTVEHGALLLRRRDGTLDERSYLADADTLTFTLTTWEAARRVGATLTK